MNVFQALINNFYVLNYEFNFLSIFLRLFIATLLGSIIGMERGLKRRPAGLRTFALVCVGSAMAMISNEYLEILHPGKIDIGRMAAQVISGIGFLGAGTIIFTKGQKTKGLTTAASLWATATVGIALGEGFYVAAFICFFLIISITTFLHILDKRLYENSKVIELYIEAVDFSCIPKLISYSRSHNFLITSFEKSPKSSLMNGMVTMFLEIDLKKRTNHTPIVEELNLIEGVTLVEEIK